MLIPKPQTTIIIFTLVIKLMFLLIILIRYLALYRNIAPIEVRFVNAVTAGRRLKFVSSGINFSRNDLQYKRKYKVQFILISSLKMLTYNEFAHL